MSVLSDRRGRSHGSIKTPTISPRSNHMWFGRNQVFCAANRISTNENESQKQTQTHHTLHTHFHSLDSLPSVLPYTADKSTLTRRGQSVLHSNWKTTGDAAIVTHFQYAKDTSSNPKPRTILYLPAAHLTHKRGGYAIAKNGILTVSGTAPPNCYKQGTIGASPQPEKTTHNPITTGTT